MLTKLLAVIALMAIFATSAQATVTKMWAPMQLAAGANPPASVLQQFKRVVATRPLSVPTWRYIKSSRSLISTWPEKWYVHQNGGRVHDKVYTHYFVMNPNSRGWQKQVAKNCPRRCFLDGAGVSAISRTSPRLQWTQTRWVSAMVSEIKAVRATGDKVIPNSVGMNSLAEMDAAGRASTEGFYGLKSLPILTHGKTWVITHAGARCGYILASFLIGRGKGDFFACLPQGGDPTKIVAPMNGPSIGRALGPAVETETGYKRKFQGGTVDVSFNGAYHLP